MNDTAQSTALVQGEQRLLVARLAQRFGIDQDALWKTLKATVFKLPGNKEASNAQVAAVMVVADQHKLNPFTREIFAFEGQSGAIVPVVSVDGWLRIINEQPAYDGVEFEYGPPSESEKHKGSPAWIEAVIFRKDRTKPTKAREFLAECYRNTGPWGSHPSRMLRHKALIQCARMAFGFAGIYDEDEAERIIEGDRPAPMATSDKLKTINAEIVSERSAGDDAPATASAKAPDSHNGPEKTEKPAAHEPAGAPLDAKKQPGSSPSPTSEPAPQRGPGVDEAFDAAKKRAAERAKGSQQPQPPAPTLPELLTMVEQSINADAVELALSLGDKLGPPDFAQLRDAAKLRKIELEGAK
jgi:phage recombination protein Bet